MKSNRIYLAWVSILLGLWTATAFAQTFTRIDTSVITRDGGYSAGSSWGDYDNDGDDDLFISNAYGNLSNKNFLYRNEGAGHFMKITSGDIVTEASNPGSIGACWGDYDNDGKLDLFVPGNAMPNRLYHNEGNGVFSKITEGVIANSSNRSTGGGWVDYDQDGDLDLFVVNGTVWVPPSSTTNFLYRNDGNGIFSKISQGLIVTEALLSECGSWADYDDDGDMDLFVANIAGNRSNRLYFNNGNGALGLVQSSEVMNDLRESWSASWGDYDNDGHLDLFVGTYLGPNLLYHNHGDGTFARVNNGPVVTASGRHFGSSWGDFDNDGDLDLVVATESNAGNLLYNNDGSGNFTRVTGQILTNSRGFTCTTSDYDNDGDLDILTVNGADFFTPVENYLYANNGTNNGWINITCVGTVSNRTAIGTRIRAKATIRGAAVWQMREIAQQSGFGGHNSLRVHFGFGDATKIDSLVIRWPSKTTEVYTNVVVNQFMTAIEGRSLTSVGERQEEQPASFSLSQNYPNPFNPETTIEYQLPRAGQVKVVIYNLAGQLVRTLLDAQHAAGKFQTHWDGKDELGNQVASGVYLYQLQAGSFQATQKMILMR